MKRFLALGDSYTCGEGVAPTARWTHQLVARLRDRGIEIGDPDTIAVTGWTTEELWAGVDRFEADGESRAPYDVVTLLIGVNDQYRGYEPAAYRKRFRDLVARAVQLAGGQPGRVLVLSVPDWSVTPFAVEDGHETPESRERIAYTIDGFNQIGAEETAAARARWVNITPLSRTQGEHVVDDNLHPGPSAYRAWAEEALPAALAALRST